MSKVNYLNPCLMQRNRGLKKVVSLTRGGSSYRPKIRAI